MEDARRIEWVDVGRYFCIMSVIVGHLQSCTVPLQRLFSGFFLTGFLFLSGFCYKNRPGFAAHVKRKGLQLFVPWLLWGLLSVAFHQLFSGWRNNATIMTLPEELKWFFLQVRGINDGPWFLAMMFVSFLPLYYLVRLYERVRGDGRAVGFLYAGVAVFYVLGKLYARRMPPFSYGSNALPWHIEYLPTSLFFMFFGYVYRQRCGAEDARPRRYLPGILATYLVIAFLPVFVRIPSVSLDILHEALYQCVGVLLLLSISKAVRPNRYVGFVGRNTLLYFPMQVYAYILLEAVFRKLFPGGYSMILSDTLASSVFAVLLAVLISCLLIVPAMVINRYFPLLAGRRAKRG